MRSYDIFSPADVEKEPIAHRISDRMEEERPQRVFIDGFSQFRHLAADGFQFRRLVQSCFRFITDRRATLLVSCDGASLRHDRNIFSAVDGLVMLESTRQSRRLRVVKFRGSDFEPGVHVMQLTGAGIIVASPAA
jgi:circadian clock protein KaiC